MLRNRAIVGLKIFPGHDEHLPNDPRLNPFVELCMNYGAPFMVHTGWNSGNPEAAKWNDPKYIVELAGNYPQLKIIICHYFWPNIAYCYEITRGYENIYFDISGLADKEIERETGRKTIKKYLEKTITNNPKSVLFGSDFGGSDLYSHIKLIESLNITNEIKKMVFWRNTVDLFLLPITI